MNIRQALVPFFVIFAVGCNSGKNSPPAGNWDAENTIAEAAAAEALALEKTACTDVDLKDRFGAVRDQGATGFCYAFATADLIGEAIHLPPPRMISAYDLITNYISMDDEGYASVEKQLKLWDEDWLSTLKNSKQSLPISARGAGWPSLLLAKSVADGYVCDEASLPSQSLAYETYKGALDTFVTKQILEDAGISKKNHIKYQLPSESPFPWQLWDLGLPLSTKIPAPFLPVVSDWQAVRVRQQAIARCKQFQKIDNLVGHDQFLDPSLEEYRKHFQENAQILLNSKWPFSIVYNSCVLHDCKSYQKESHVSVIVGRRWSEEQKECQVQIRNSWGAGCILTKSGVSCENGHYWIGLKSLSNYVTAFSYITAKAPTQ